MTELLLLEPIASGLMLFLTRHLWGPAQRVGIVDAVGGRDEHENLAPLTVYRKRLKRLDSTRLMASYARNGLRKRLL